MRFLFLLVLLASPFESCGDDSPPGDETVLPRVDVESCTRDEDCAVDRCEDHRCLAGRCALVAMTLDRDGDGETPPVCGGADCNDFDPNVSSSVAERCNLRDDDCDGEIDEGASTASVTVNPGIFDRAGRVIPLADSFGAAAATAAAIFVVPVSLDGELGTPRELIRLSRGSRFVGMHVAQQGSRTLVVAWTDTGGSLFAELDGEALMQEGALAWEGPVRAIHVAPHAGGWTLAADRFDETFATVERVVRLGIDAPVVVLSEGDDLLESTLNVASAGSHVVVPGVEALHFVSESEQVTVPLSEDAATLDVASGNGAALVLRQRETTFLERYDLTGMRDQVEAPPIRTSTRVEFVTIDGTALLVGVGAIGSPQLWRFDPETLTELSTPDVAFGGTPPVSIAVRPSAIGSYAPGAMLLSITTTCE